MKNIRFILPIILLIFTLFSCENQEFDDLIDTSALSSSENNLLMQLQNNLISRWDFENSLDDEMGQNNFNIESKYNICSHNYIPGKVDDALWLRVGQLKCEIENSFVTDEREFSFFFWAYGYNQQDHQDYFCLKSDVDSILCLNVIIQKNFEGKINEYSAYFQVNKDFLEPAKLNKDDQWYFYGIIYEKPELKFYINEDLKATVIIDYDLHSVDYYSFIFSPYNFFNEIGIDNAKLYNKALKSNEVMALYKSEWY